MTDNRDPQLNRHGNPRGSARNGNMGMWAAGLVVLLLILGAVFYYNGGSATRTADNAMNRSTATSPSTTPTPPASTPNNNAAPATSTPAPANR